MIFSDILAYLRIEHTRLNQQAESLSFMLQAADQLDQLSKFVDNINLHLKDPYLLQLKRMLDNGWEQEKRVSRQNLISLQNQIHGIERQIQDLEAKSSTVTGHQNVQNQIKVERKIQDLDD